MEITLARGSVSKVADDTIALPRLVQLELICRPGRLWHLRRKRTRNGVKSVFRRGVVYRHLSTFRTLVLDVTETLRHERVEGETSVEQSR